jgi:hypothetical protein
MSEPELDQSQKAAPPLKPMAASELVRKLHTPGIEALSEDAAAALDENRKQAAVELASIFALQESPDFKWFEKTFIIEPYDEAFRKLRDPHAREEGETLEMVQTAYLALRTVRAGVLTREIIHRELIDPRDEQIAKLRQTERPLMRCYNKTLPAITRSCSVRSIR